MYASHPYRPWNSLIFSEVHIFYCLYFIGSRQIPSDVTQNQEICYWTPLGKTSLDSTLIDEPLLSPILFSGVWCGHLHFGFWLQYHWWGTQQSFASSRKKLTSWLAGTWPAHSLDQSASPCSTIPHKIFERMYFSSSRYILTRLCSEKLSIKDIISKLYVLLIVT